MGRPDSYFRDGVSSEGTDGVDSVTGESGFVGQTINNGEEVDTKWTSIRKRGRPYVSGGSVHGLYHGPYLICESVVNYFFCYFGISEYRGSTPHGIG